MNENKHRKIMITYCFKIVLKLFVDLFFASLWMNRVCNHIDKWFVTFVLTKSMMYSMTTKRKKLKIYVWVVQESSFLLGCGDRSPYRYVVIVTTHFDGLIVTSEDIKHFILEIALRFSNFCWLQPLQFSQTRMANCCGNQKMINRGKVT